ncbi:MAG: hypothetical protein SO434_03345 [Eubacteriales bacterium]|nr:hypothetical protein [Eubacteriales bacterium]
MNNQDMKIYFDGSHYIGIPKGAFPSKKGRKRRVVKPMQQTQKNRRLKHRPKPQKNALKRHTKKVNRYQRKNANLIKEKRQTENAISNIMDVIEQGGQSLTIVKRMRELESKLTNIEKRIAIEKSQTVLRLTKEQIIEYYKSALEKEPLLLINHFIKEIQLYDDKMIIIYNTPKPINLDESQGFSFYDKNVKMPYTIQSKKHYGLKDFRLVMRL